ncbi:hypothetical protein SD10_14485 [Spirosoma radiotolerans]|uniref:Uncharacterized protein n=1 Tax=Spirosoma radiotolerans TaxID=1379870 RepID=A0A0E3ZVP5_9BACT|nr:hypothetical protein SD10_14485 [Spirosoma radiotolerans]
MIDTIRQTFPKIQENNCLQTLTDSEFCIYDTDKGRCTIQSDLGGIKHFTIENPTQRNLHFLAIDKCLFLDSDGTQRCDCAVFDSKTFCFIEIKEVDHAARRAEQLRKAKEQLKTTILYFQEQLEFK